MDKKWHRITATIVISIIWGLLILTPLNITWKWIDLFYCFLAFSVAYWLPDLDQELDFLHHRDSSTHSSIFPVIITILFWSLASAVFSLTYATHLFADLSKKTKIDKKIDPGKPIKPKKSVNNDWLKGFGLIKFGKDGISSKKSITWLISNGLICIILGILQLFIRV